ncbi:MAG: hypothetical protein CSA97_05165 [Bacteroidetes bacterium]|nr:MAG: hypothetical protein CSA97_05165 [Bacteroidota bacterium]
MVRSRILGLFLVQLLLLSVSVVSARDVKLRVRLDAQVPSPMVLLRQVDIPQSLIDTAYMEEDGCYHFSIPDFQPGLYGLLLEGVAAIPLLLLKPKRRVWVGIDGRLPLDGVEVEGADEAMVYLSGYAAYSRYRAFAKAKDDLEGYCGSGEEACRAMGDMLEAEEHLLDSTLLSLEGKAKDVRLRSLLELMRPVAGGKDRDWFPGEVLVNPLAAGSRLLRRRATDYLLAQRDTLLTHEEQRAAFLRAIRSLGARRMDADVAVSIRGQFSYLFSGSSFPLVSAAVDSMRFGPVAGLPGQVGRSAPVEGLAALALGMQDLDGEATSVVNPKSRYTLVVLWSVWCAHCQAMLPRLYDMWQGLDKRFMRVSCVCLDRGEGGMDAAYVKSRGWGWDNGFTLRDSTVGLEEALDFQGTPELYVYDVHGRLVSRPATEQELRAIIDRLLEEEERRTDKRW